MKKLYAVILNFNGFVNTSECVKSMMKCRIPQGFSLTIVIVDNASRDGSGKKLKKEFPHAVTLLNSQNLGYSGGNNVGIEYALSQEASHILVINNDTILTRSSLFDLIIGMRESGFDVVCPKIYFEKGFEYHKDSYRKEDLGKVFWYAGGEMDWQNIIGHHTGVDQVDHGQFDKIAKTEFITGACFLGTREIFETIGVFNEDYFLYYEDADLSMRIKRAGFLIGFIPSAVIYHKNAGSTGGSGSSLQDYFITRNRLQFGMKYAQLRTKLALVKEAMKLSVSGRAWQKRGVRDFFMHNFGKGTYPIQ